jgi:hypothetical protein
MKWVKRLFKKKQVEVAETKQLNIPEETLKLFYLAGWVDAFGRTSVDKWEDSYDRQKIKIFGSK